ncbi:Uncharacterized protein SCF082_LOCUS13982 [Durusdinium trenchii]|uniref:Uncharacterized protein n=1 Tax=Durusdinium trenchii TaxID=1381693 RepID=A0ABP0JUS8_9DINO
MPEALAAKMQEMDAAMAKLHVTPPAGADAAGSETCKESPAAAATLTFSTSAAAAPAPMDIDPVIPPASSAPAEPPLRPRKQKGPAGGLLRQPHDIVDATEPGSGEMKDAVDDETSRGGEATLLQSPAKLTGLDGTWETRLSRTFRKYLTGFFLPDVVLAILSWVELFVSSQKLGSPTDSQSQACSVGRMTEDIPACAHPETRTLVAD